MVLWNNFTHFLFDPVNGDQEQQDEARTTLGLNAVFTRSADIMGVGVEGRVGFQDRYDDIFIDRRHTAQRAVLDYCNIALPASPTTGQLPAPADAHTDPDQAVAFRAPGGACTSDTARLNDLGLFAEATIHWTDWLRTTVGLREEVYNAHDRSLTTGFAGSTSQRMLQPKGSIAVGPFYKTELYVSAGRGFHSEDVRGVFGTVPGEGQPGLLGATPLLAPAYGFEVGMRTDLIPKTQVQVAVFREDFESEQRYVADEGEDTASAPSRRQGIEVSAQFRPVRWLEFNTDLAWSQAHYRASDATLALFDLDGTSIANAPSFIGSFGVLVNHIGPWFGGLQWRKLGAYPISDGDEEPKDKGYSEINLNVGYTINDRLKAELQVFNLADSHANSSAYFYQTRVAPGGASAGLRYHQGFDLLSDPPDGAALRALHPDLRILIATATVQLSSARMRHQKELTMRNAIIAPVLSAGLAIAALAVAGQASAHARLILGSPKAGATVAAPKALVLHYSEELVPAAGRA